MEYNGCWLLDRFFEAMPESWVINQMMTFFDANTFLSYNQNMRQLVFDKIQMTQMVVFNRCKGGFDKMPFHKAVRGISRRPDIVYEYLGGNPEFDDIEDPLPFDVDAPVVQIEDRDFAWFYRDMAEKGKSYIGKTVKFKGMAALSKKVPAGFAVKTGGLLKDIKTRDWLTVTGKIVYEYNSVYHSQGPVIIAEKLERAEPPDDPVATYY